MIKITVNGGTLYVEKGALLSSVLDIEKPCGGRGTCKKCTVLVNGEKRLACQYTVNEEITVVTNALGDISSESGVSTSGRETENMCLALDIGTTTLALALVSLDEKKAVRVLTKTNPQRKFGADVITRIEYAQKNSVYDLHKALIQAINELIDDIGIEKTDTMYVAANVTMLHTLFNVDCSSIGVAPYKAQFLGEKTVEGEKIGINKVKTVKSLPSVASFVGADIVAGINLIGMPENDKYRLLIDLGTNAEVVLFSNNTGVATAAAAGPCFEGANIKCGSSATDGAVYSFSLDYGHSQYKTVNGKAPSGICGTGLIDMIAALLKNELIDEAGYMEDDYHISESVYLSPEDVRQYQLAKSAVYSAILSLMKTQGITFDQIDKMYISGGFSSKIDINNAVSTGLFPQMLKNKTVSINNSSLQGTIKYALDGEKLNGITQMLTYVDLSSNPHFSQLFMENMMFE